MFIRALFLSLLVVPLSVSAAQLAYQGIPDGSVEIRGANSNFNFPHLAIYGENGLVLRLEGTTPHRWKAGNIGAFDISPTGDLWLGRNGRIFLNGTDTGGQLLERTGPFQPYRRSGRIFVSRLGDVWISGAAKMRRPDGMFVPSGFSLEDEMQIEPRCDDAFGNIWAAIVDRNGRHQGLAVRPAADARNWCPVALPSGLSETWIGLCVDDVGFLWLATADTIVQIDPRKTNGIVRLIRPRFGPAITAIAPVANRQILVGFADGSIRELKTRPKQEPVFEMIEQISGGPVRAMLENNAGTLWLLVGSNLHRSQTLQQVWQQAWTEGPRMPAGNHDNIFTAADGKLFSAGGKTFFGWPASKWVNLDELWSFDPRHSKWALEPPMLEAGKAYSGIGRLDKEIWVIGGYFRTVKGTKATDTVEIYDPETRRYRFGPKYPTARGQIVAATVTDRIYAVGGEGDQVASPETFSIGVGETEWRPEPPAPGPVTQAAGCVIGDRIFIAAGPRSECPGLFVYDVNRQEWSTVKHPAVSPPAAPLVAAWEDEVWVMGGRGKSGGEVAIHGYSTKSGSWRRGPDLPIPISWGAATTVNGRIMIAGGAYQAESAGNYFNSDRTFFWKPR